MYKTSTDRRFLKNKAIIRRAFIELTIEKGIENMTITELTKRADINRMTFYSHYDMIEDIFQEFIDDMETELDNLIQQQKKIDYDLLFQLLNQQMFQEIEFFSFIAKDGNYAEFRNTFRRTIKKILDRTSKENHTLTLEERIKNDIVASGIAYLYLDWLAGEYGDIEIEDLITIAKKFQIHSTQ